MTTKSSSEEEFTKILQEKALALVKSDVNYFTQRLDEKFIYINANGRMFNKKEYIDNYVIADDINWKSQVSVTFFL